MKILNVLNPLLKDYKFAGAAMFGINLGMELLNDGNKIDFIANKETLSEILETHNISGIDIFDPEIKTKNKSIQEIIKYSVDKYYEGNYDILHIHLHQMSVLSNICKFVPKDVRVVYTQHTSTILGRFSLGYRDFAKELSSDTDRNIRVVMPSKNMYDIWTEYLETNENLHNIRIINNGVSIENELISNELTEDQVGRYIACGRLDPNKGILEIAKVFAKNKLPITIIGNRSKGTLKESEDDDKYFDEFVKTVNENENIKWVKQVDHKTLMSMLKYSKALVAFSKKENSPLIIIEAEINRLPIFYLEESGTKEIIENCNNNFVGTFSIMVSKEQLYRKRESIRIEIINKELLEFDRLISNSSGLIENRNYDLTNFPYSMKLCAKNYKKLYKELIN